MAAWLKLAHHPPSLMVFVVHHASSLISTLLFHAAHAFPNELRYHLSALYKMQSRFLQTTVYPFMRLPSFLPYRGNRAESSIIGVCPQNGHGFRLDSLAFISSPQFIISSFLDASSLNHLCYDEYYIMWLIVASIWCSFCP